MAGFMSSLWGRKNTQEVSRDAIVGLRQQLQMIEKKEEYTQKKVEEELAKAKANAVSNKAGMSIQTSRYLNNRFTLGLIILLHCSDAYGCAASIAALKRKKMLESELEKLQGTKFQLEMNVNTLESAKMNQETMAAMKKASDALKHIHGNLYAPSLTLPRCIRSYTNIQYN